MFVLCDVRGGDDAKQDREYNGDSHRESEKIESRWDAGCSHGWWPAQWTGYQQADGWYISYTNWLSTFWLRIISFFLECSTVYLQPLRTAGFINTLCCQCFNTVLWVSGHPKNSVEALKHKETWMTWMGKQQPRGERDKWNSYNAYFTLLPAGLLRSGKLRVLNLLAGWKSAFSPCRGDSCTDSRESWHGRVTRVRLPCEISNESVHWGGYAAPKIQKFPSLGKESPHAGEPFGRFLQMLGAYRRPTTLHYSEVLRGGCDVTTDQH